LPAAIVDSDNDNDFAGTWSPDVGNELIGGLERNDVIYRERGR
jgi:hypothetical protein